MPQAMITVDGEPFLDRQEEQEDVADYFQWRVPERPPEEGAAEVLHRATTGIPLAVREAAAIWQQDADLEDIAGSVPNRPAREQIVRLMSERFLLHCFGSAEEEGVLERLYALALAYRPDADLLANMLQTEDLEGELSELERRYSFVFVTGMKLHDAVEAFLREYLGEEARRRSPRVQAIHLRAVQHLRVEKGKRDWALRGPDFEFICDDPRFRRCSVRSYRYD